MLRVQHNLVLSTRLFWNLVRDSMIILFLGDLCISLGALDWSAEPTTGAGEWAAEPAASGGWGAEAAITNSWE